MLATLRKAAISIPKLYTPSTLKQKGLTWSISLFIITLVLVIAVLGWYWDTEPEPFDVRVAALERADNETGKVVVGYTFTSTLMRIAETLLHKRGGYLSNDVTPPGALMDNIPNWEFGALVMLRDASAALRNHISRSQSQSVEDPDLARAEPQFNFQNDSWILPATESEYKAGLEALNRFLTRLADPQLRNAQFYARADNLRQYLEIIEKRLGSLSQRLSASVGQARVNTDLAGDTAATQATETPTSVVVKTPWLELDDVFYEARGASWALIHIFKAVEHDFGEILRKKNALISLRQIIRELDSTQQPTLSPMVLNGGGFGLFANYSLTMANYLARANAAVIDLRSLLEQG
ncbi:MAG: DUF2333 family protein [Gammaproteobacteria bacterium]|nr:DUF2333 family protein [Gammaproteobacteria bacterium]